MIFTGFKLESQYKDLGGTFFLGRALKITQPNHVIKFISISLHTQCGLFQALTNLKFLNKKYAFSSIYRS